jgi:hypothetical protein
VAEDVKHFFMYFGGFCTSSFENCLLHIKRNNYQNLDITYRMGENLCNLFTQKGFDTKN